jgi:hypothetical protein
MLKGEDIIIGTILGDAHVSKLIGRSKNSKISWTHSKKQEEYAKWKAENCLNNYSVYNRKRFDKRTDKIYESITIYSKYDSYNKFRDLFYDENDDKIITENILNKLTPLSISVWYMDDGSLYYNGKNCHLTLSVDNFYNDVDLIVDFFKSKYDLNFKKSQKRST